MSRKGKWLTFETERLANKLRVEEDQEGAERLPKTLIRVTPADVARHQLWKTRQLASPRLLDKIEREFHSQSGPSAETIRLFPTDGIKPQDMGEFVQSATRLLRQALTFSSPTISPVVA